MATPVLHNGTAARRPTTIRLVEVSLPAMSVGVRSAFSLVHTYLEFSRRCPGSIDYSNCVSNNVLSAEVCFNVQSSGLAGCSEAFSVRVFRSGGDQISFARQDGHIGFR